MTGRSPLVDASWLASRMAADAICVLDASWHPASAARDGRAEFERAHIPSARFFDLAQAADPHSGLSHTLPGPGHLAACAAAVGARRDRCIVLYDSAGTAPSARAWWMLTAYGYEDVRVLDGGLRAWQAAGLPLEQGAVPARADAPEELPPPDPRWVADHERVGQAIRSGHVVLDARSAARFCGEAPEPVAGIRSGHIAGSANLPYQRLLDETKGTFLPAPALREQFASAGVRMQDPVVCSCGSGVTACVLALGLHTLGHPAVAVYDGSWTDWAHRHLEEQSCDP